MVALTLGCDSQSARAVRRSRLSTRGKGTNDEMRIGVLQEGGRQVLAAERDGLWYGLEPGPGSPPDPTVLDLLRLAEVTVTDTRVADTRLLPPVAPPRNVFCLGKNYREHAKEFATYAGESETAPEAPIVFTKPVAALCGARDDIVVDPSVTQALDYEVELAVVIGRSGYAIAVDHAEDHIAGYTVLNDTTARDLQQRHRQWFLGKSLPRATPVGPAVVSPDELDGLEERRIRCWVNDELRQDAVLGEMIFGVAEAIAAISAIVPLEAGDLIAMGTPSGVGVGFSPPRCLDDGDRVVCEIEGIGRLENTVRFTPVAGALFEEEAAHA
jgi:2-keto-4-pentenoate hydratase/2-oxohepta-3-ene-1,7-dioic acid hydratase in catechol pathway